MTVLLAAGTGWSIIVLLSVSVGVGRLESESVEVGVDVDVAEIEELGVSDIVAVTSGVGTSSPSSSLPSS